MLASRFARAAVPIIAVAWFTPAHAQLPSLVEISAQYTPPTDINVGGADARKFQISSYQVALSLPIRLSPVQFLIPGITYQADSIALDHDGDSTFHSPSMSMTFVQLLDKRWSITARGAASLSSSFDTVDRRMIAYSALALAGWKASDELTLAAGMLLVGGFGQTLPLPALSMRWRPRDDLFVDVFLPAFASIRHVRWNRVELGARLEIAGNVFAIRNDPREPCPADNDGTDMMATKACLDHVRYTIGSAGLVAGVRLTSSIWLTAFAGWGFYRRGDLMDRDNDQLPGTTHGLPSALFVRTNLAWRLPGS